MRMTSARFSLMFLLGTLLLIGCSPRTSPPGPDSASGVLGNAGYVYHVWPEGLRILILHDVPNSLFCQGEGGTSSSLYRLECEAGSHDGRRVRWEIETSDGISASLDALGKRFIVEYDTVFLVPSSRDVAEVQILARDLSIVPFDTEQIQAFISSDVEIAAFVQAVSPP